MHKSTGQKDSILILMVNDKLTGDEMPAVNAQIRGLSDTDFRSITEEERYPFAKGQNSRQKNGESYASLIKRHGITNFIFHYATGAFYALDDKGVEVASGKTIREVLDSL